MTVYVMTLCNNKLYDITLNTIGNQTSVLTDRIHCLTFSENDLIMSMTLCSPSPGTSGPEEQNKDR